MASFSALLHSQGRGDVQSSDDSAFSFVSGLTLLLLGIRNLS